jgi:hypothetical protein
MRTLLGMLVAACTLASPAGAQQSTLRQDVESLLAAMVAAFKAEPASVARFYTDDASILGGGQRAGEFSNRRASWI